MKNFDSEFSWMSSPHWYEEIGSSMSFSADA